MCVLSSEKLFGCPRVRRRFVPTCCTTRRGCLWLFEHCNLRFSSIPQHQRNARKNQTVVGTLDNEAKRSLFFYVRSGARKKESTRKPKLQAKSLFGSLWLLSLTESYLTLVGLLLSLNKFNFVYVNQYRF